MSNGTIEILERVKRLFEQRNLTWDEARGQQIARRIMESLYNQSQLSPTNKTIETDEPYPDFSQIVAVRRIFIVIFLLEFVICVTGNLMVFLTVYRTKAMHTPVNYYIVNLGICDFLVGALVLPIKLLELAADAEMSILNDVICTVDRFLEAVLIFTTLLTLVAICIERYYAVVYPVRSRVILKNSRVLRVIFVVWIIPCLLAAPNIYPYTASNFTLHSEYGEFSRRTCFDGFTDEFRRGYFLFLFVFMYVLPLIFIGGTCFSIYRALMKKIPVQQDHRDAKTANVEKGRQKVAKMVMVIVLVFFLCWSPYFLVTIVTQLQTKNFLQEGHFFFTMLIINLLGFTNSCINPIIYFAMSTRFRKGFKGILMSIWQCTKKARFSPGNSSISLRRPSQRTGLVNRPNQISGSPSPLTPTPNNSSGRADDPEKKKHTMPEKPNDTT